MRRHPILRRIWIGLMVVGLAVLYILWGNTSIGVSRYSIRAPGLPEEFSGFTIAQVSDLHNTEFGENNRRLLSRMAAESPDIIVITGDLIDAFRTDMDLAVDFARNAAFIAPTYYVQGNHERHNPGDYEHLSLRLRDAGVTVLENEAVLLNRNGASIPLIGLLDRGQETTSETLVQLSDAFSDFTLVLSHRPEYIGSYAGTGAGLVFTGHAHGGQFRLPFIGGLYSPGQGVFPTYDSGLYTVGSTQMIVSRGLGNSHFPFRLNNRPELVVAELIPAE